MVTDTTGQAEGSLHRKEYVKKFLNLSGSERYGIEVEQLVIARIIDAQVYEIPLTYSRPRDPYTLSSKFLDSLYAILKHRTELQNKGFERIVTFAEQMKNFLEQGADSFALDLNDIGSSGKLQFHREKEKYSIIC